MSIAIVYRCILVLQGIEQAYHAGVPVGWAVPTGYGAGPFHGPEAR